MIAPAVGGEETSPPSGVAPFRLAVMDTDTPFLELLGKRLTRLRWDHRGLAGAVPIAALLTMRLGAIVIDPTTLGAQAWEYLQRVCTELPDLAVIVCTGPSTVAQRVRGLRLGADDWITKPCHPEEVIARVEAAVRRRRRAHGSAAEPVIQAAELEIRVNEMQAYVDGVSIGLSRRQFEVLHLLAAADGRVLERGEIYQRIWGYAMASGDRSVDVFIRKLRIKLEQASPDWTYIHTLFGVGYRFTVEPVEPPEAG